MGARRVLEDRSPFGEAGIVRYVCWQAHDPKAKEREAWGAKRETKIRSLEETVAV